jgi:hypothetical protein
MTGEQEQRDTIRGLVERIDEDVDPLHVDFTPSVLALSGQGLPAVRAVLDLLDAPDRLTRLRAQRVVEGVVMRRNGWTPGQGYHDPAGEERTRATVTANGSYRADAPSPERRRAIDLWRRWLQQQETGAAEEGGR